MTLKEAKAIKEYIETGLKAAWMPPGLSALSGIEIGTYILSGLAGKHIVQISRNEIGFSAVLGGTEIRVTNESYFTTAMASLLIKYLEAGNKL